MIDLSQYELVQTIIMFIHVSCYDVCELILTRGRKKISFTFTDFSRFTCVMKRNKNESFDMFNWYKVK